MKKILLFGLTIILVLSLGSIVSAVPLNTPGESTILKLGQLGAPQIYIDWIVLGPGILGTPGFTFGNNLFNYADVVPGSNMTWLPSAGATFLADPPGTNIGAPGIDPYYGPGYSLYPGVVYAPAAEAVFAAQYLNYYIYFYQLENTTDPGLNQGTIIDVFSNRILAIGYLTNSNGDAVDLDIIHTIVGENEPVSGLQINATPSEIDVSFFGNNFNASFGGAGGTILPNLESGTFFIVSDLPPVMGLVHVIDQGVYEGGVPVPVPEPTTMLLLGSGLIGLAGMARRKFKK